MTIQEMISRVNPHVRSLQAYHLHPEDVPVKLNQNENPFDWPAPIKDEILAFCRKRPWNRYPNFIPEDLKQALAAFVGYTADHVIAGNGSNEMLLVTLLSLTQSEGTVIICQPTFTVYKLLSSGMGRNVQEVFLDENMCYRCDRICEASLNHPEALIIISSPNNPTGSALSEKEIRRILETHRGFFLLDQAYVEFGGYNALPLVKEYPNLLITRTFSKALRGAGVRMGYLIGTPDIIREMNKIKLPYNINFFSERVAIVLLSHREEINTAISYITKQRERVFSFLQTLPFEQIYPTEANFILIRTNRKDSLFVHLKQDGILVRDVSSYPMLENCLRINIGTEEENTHLMRALSGFFSHTQ